MKTLLTLVGLVTLGGVLQVVRKDANRAVSGESVYVSEGCIHCHSQFSRPDSLDTEIYGPATLPDSHPGGAVLIGNRRQGPDLSSVGLRRSRQWNREHLIDPDLVSPGSRMPSYRHLFEAGDLRGDVLLDYLQSLGTEGAQEWYGQTSSWGADLVLGDPEHGGELFRQMCFQCHGSDADGKGVLAERFQPLPTDFTSGQLRYAPVGLPWEVRGPQLGRIVKYGIAGTAMPGHEYLTDEQIADLVAFVGGISVPVDSQK